MNKFIFQSFLFHKMTISFTLKVVDTKLQKPNVQGAKSRLAVCVLNDPGLVLAYPHPGSKCPCFPPKTPNP